MSSNPTAPSSQEADFYRAQYEGAIDLITHEDGHNWNKLHHFMYGALALLAACAYCANEIVGKAKAEPVMLLLALAGMSMVGRVVSIAFAKTLRDGVLCLKNHREIVDVLEQKVTDLRICACPPTFGKKKSPTRSVLIGLPLLFALIWSLTLVASLVALVVFTIEGQLAFETWHVIPAVVVVAWILHRAFAKCRYWADHTETYDVKNPGAWTECLQTEWDLMCFRVEMFYVAKIGNDDQRRVLSSREYSRERDKVKKAELRGNKAAPPQVLGSFKSKEAANAWIARSLDVPLSPALVQKVERGSVA